MGKSTKRVLNTNEGQIQHKRGYGTIQMCVVSILSEDPLHSLEKNVGCRKLSFPNVSLTLNVL